MKSDSAAARRALRCALLAAAAAAAATTGNVWAHAFGARYELPVPVWLFVVGGALTVTLTFVVLAVFARGGAERYARACWKLQGSALGRLMDAPALAAALKLLGVAGLVLVVVAGWFGATDPNRNIAPTLVWIVWWVGFSYLAMLVGNVWPVVNPWRSLYDLFWAWRGRAPGASTPWPASAGSWPAFGLLLAFGWVELVFPFRATPVVLAAMVAAYSVLTWVGMARYGPNAWLDNADPFHRVFELFSRFAPIAATPRDGLVLRPHAAGLLWRDATRSSTTEVAFVMAMLAIVLFDALQGSKHWAALEDLVHALDPKLGDAGWIGLHSVGLLATWGLFLALYVGACAIAKAGTDATLSTLACARAFAPTLIPIAVGYHFAHTFTYLLVQGQTLQFLVSDPLGIGWNLFGTRDAQIDIAIIGTKTAWYLALSAIVMGHAISVYLAHVTAERLLGTRAQVFRVLLPMTTLMVIYTIVSLMILADPLVRYSGPQDTII